MLVILRGSNKHIENYHINDVFFPIGYEYLKKRFDIWVVFIIYTGYYCYIEVTSFTENKFTFIFMGVISNSLVSWNNAKESSFSLQNILVELLNNKHL